jgi:hypothetical protein
MLISSYVSDICLQSVYILCTECKIRFLGFKLILNSSKIDDNNNKECPYFDLENENRFLRNVSTCLHGVRIKEDYTKNDA